MADIERSIAIVDGGITNRGALVATLPLLLLATLSACAGSKHTDEAQHEREESSYYDDSAPKRSHNESDESSSGTKVSNNLAAEPQFTENMSVDEAIRAVPPGIERRNIDQETLGKPLQDVALYEPCKAASSHFKIKVAVWNGKAVGIDVTSIPKNDKLAGCIKSKIAEVTWEKKVKSLNTIEYQF